MPSKHMQPWHGYNSTAKAKLQSRKLAAIYYRAGATTHDESYTRRGQRVIMCHDVVATSNGQVVAAWACEDRLCPLCAIRLSRRIAANARIVLTRALEGGRRAYLLTLTQRNCDAQTLPQRVTDMLDAWHKILHDMRGQRKYIAGYARTIEITIGRDGLYHPHMHAIMLLDAGAPIELMRARYWATLWQRYMATDAYQGDTLPICDIRPIRPNKRRHLSSQAAAAAEVAKYTAKSSKILMRPDAYDRILAIDAAIKGRRLRTYGGVWRAIRAEMRLEDTLIQPEPSPDALNNIPIEIWKWAGADYQRVE